MSSFLNQSSLPSSVPHRKCIKHTQHKKKLPWMHRINQHRQASKIAHISMPISRGRCLARYAGRSGAFPHCPSPACPSPPSLYSQRSSSHRSARYDVAVAGLRSLKVPYFCTAALYCAKYLGMAVLLAQLTTHDGMLPRRSSKYLSMAGRTRGVARRWVRGTMVGQGHHGGSLARWWVRGTMVGQGHFWWVTGTFGGSRALLVGQGHHGGSGANRLAQQASTPHVHTTTADRVLTA